MFFVNVNREIEDSTKSICDFASSFSLINWHTIYLMKSINSIFRAWVIKLLRRYIAISNTLKWTVTNKRAFIAYLFIKIHYLIESFK